MGNIQQTAVSNHSCFELENRRPAYLMDAVRAARPISVPTAPLPTAQASRRRRSRIQRRRPYFADRCDREDGYVAIDSASPRRPCIRQARAGLGPSQRDADRSHAALSGPEAHPHHRHHTTTKAHRRKREPKPVDISPRRFQARSATADVAYSHARPPSHLARPETRVSELSAPPSKQHHIDEQTKDGPA